MIKRIALGLAGSLGATLLILVGVVGGFVVGALPAGFLFQAEIISGPVLNVILPLGGIVVAGMGCWAAVQGIRYLHTWLHRRRLPRARRGRMTAEATVVGHRSKIFTYRGTTTRSYTLKLLWKDPVTNEPRRLERRYAFRQKPMADAFYHDYCLGRPRVPVLMKDPGHLETAIIDIPYAPAWTEMW